MMHRPYRLILAAALLTAPLCVAAMVEEQLPLTLDSGQPMAARLRFPVEVYEPLPVIVLIGGFDRGAAALDLLPPRDDAILVGLNYPVPVPRRIGWRDIPRLAGQFEAGIATTREALGKLHTALQARPQVDPGRITIVGVSLGAPFAVMAAAEHGYPALVVAHGFGEVGKVIRHQFERRWGPRYGFAGRAAARLAQLGISALIAIPEPETFAERLQAHQRVLFIAAEADDFIPASATHALHHALERSSASVEHQTTVGKHVRGKNREAVDAIRLTVEDWLRREGLS